MAAVAPVRKERSGRSLDLAFMLGGTALLAAVVGLSTLLAADRGDALTRNTVRLSLAWYAAALCVMMRLQATDWAAMTALGRAARWCWTWGIVVFLVHLAMAFHYFHDWSHAHAFETTRQASGVGEGIFVSYVFTLWWAFDAAAWWLAPAWYARRPIWIGRTLHLFMLFIVFNGMVVFESGPIRCAGVVLFLTLPVVWLLARRSRLELAA